SLGCRIRRCFSSLAGFADRIERCKAGNGAEKSCTHQILGYLCWRLADADKELVDGRIWHPLGPRSAIRGGPRPANPSLPDRNCLCSACRSLSFGLQGRSRRSKVPRYWPKSCISLNFQAECLPK